MAFASSFGFLEAPSITSKRGIGQSRARSRQALVRMFGYHVPEEQTAHAVLRRKATSASAYEEAGSGFPLLLIAGGGSNSNISYFTGNSPFNPMEEFKGEYRCIAMDLRNANGGESAGPLEIERPWDSYADDQFGLMDHLGHKEFMVMGFCIGGPLHLEPAEAGAGACRRRACWRSRAGSVRKCPISST